jgi:hypothetical protein
LPCIDKSGKSLQLWKVNDHTLVGTVFTTQKNLIIVPSKKIKTLSREIQNPSILINELEKSSLKCWNIVYNSRTNEIDIWPHLIASSKNWVNENMVVDKSPYKNMTKIEWINSY